MKKQVLAVAMLGLTSVAFAQKNEVKALEKAVKSGKIAEYASLINQAESLIGNADEKTKAKYYYLKAKAMLGGNNADKVVKALGEFEDNKSSKYATEIEQLKKKYEGDLVNSAIEDAKKDKGEASSKKLLAAYKIGGNQEYLFYAAEGFLSVKKYDKALPLYEELNKSGFTGAKTEYFAKSKISGEVQLFSDKKSRDQSVKLGTHITPTENEKPSLRPNIIKNIALLNIQLGNTDAGLAAIKDARAADPNNVDLIIAEANLYLKLDKKDKFKALMEQAIKQDPNNPVLFYNLGVITADLGDYAKAREYYQKSLDIKGDDINTNFNMAALILKGEKPLVDEMNALGTSAADNKKFDELQEKKNGLYKEAIPYLEKILSLDAKNASAIETLKNIYGAIGDTANFKKMKALLESL